MRVSEAVAGRRSIRSFLPDPVDRAVLERVFDRARRAPSGGNVQPWNATVVSGAALHALIAAVGAAVPQGRAGFSGEYTIYPPGLSGRYEASRQAVGEAMYRALDIARGDKAGRLAQFTANYRAFGAPVLVLVHTPRLMGAPQWADIGMWLQTVMLLLREEGLDSCAQEAWSVYQRQVRAAIPLPDDHILFCGLSVGRAAEAPVNRFPVARSPLADQITWCDTPPG
jgi:nitroreductase